MKPGMIAGGVIDKWVAAIRGIVVRGVVTELQRVHQKNGIQENQEEHPNSAHSSSSPRVPN
jgi:hypothetical protein